MSPLSRAELDALRRLRERFLGSGPGEGGYWESKEQLALYDRTFAERIGWKWDAVLRELRERGWRPEGRSLVDWGCGSGVAARRVLGEWPGGFDEVRLYDASRLAREFARAAVEREFGGGVGVREVDGVDGGGFLLLVSHVLNELAEAEVAKLLSLVRLAREVIWVEAGTHANSRRLGSEVREPLVGSGEFSVVAPCPHQERCGMLQPENERHWCHSFAEAPRAIFQDAEWMRLGRELRIDLRAAPYAFLVLEKRVASSPTDAARMIGRPRDYKGYSKLLSCEPAGVFERMLQKRDAPALLKALQRQEGAPIYRWQLSGEKIVGGSAGPGEQPTTSTTVHSPKPPLAE